MFDVPSLPNKGKFDIVVGAPGGACPYRLKSKTPTVKEWHEWCQKIINKGLARRPKEFYTPQALIYWLKYDLWRKDEETLKSQLPTATLVINEFFNDEPYIKKIEAATSSIPKKDSDVKLENKKKPKKSTFTKLPKVHVKPSKIPKIPKKLK